MTYVFLAGLLAVFFALALFVVRALKGPTIFDRLVAARERIAQVEVRLMAFDDAEKEGRAWVAEQPDSPVAWWMLAGAGWVAEDYLLYLRDVSLRKAMAPALAGHGRIAFLRESDIWPVA